MAEKMGIEYSGQARAQMMQYLQDRPQGKFGKHQYELGETEEIAKKRGFFKRYQEYYAVPNEAL